MDPSEHRIRLKKYALEVYAPGSRSLDVVCTIESDEPFLPIHVGDLLNPRTWDSHYCSAVNSQPSKFGIVLRVIGIEHYIFQKDEGFSQHKLGIFTEALDDVAESRPI